MKIDIKEIDLEDLKNIEDNQQKEIEFLDYVCNNILIPLVMLLAGILCGLLAYKVIY